MANKMEKRNQYNPQSVIPPGCTLMAKLREMDMSIEEFAMKIERPEQLILEIAKGTQPISYELAVAFERITQIPTEFWLSRQKIYDAFRAKEIDSLRMPTIKRRSPIVQISQFAH